MASSQQSWEEQSDLMISNWKENEVVMGGAAVVFRGKLMSQSLLMSTLERAVTKGSEAFGRARTRKCKTGPYKCGDGC